MSDAKFTKGEWFCNGRLISSDGEFIATASDTDKSWPETQANAHLIAAAPSMYEMLKEARKLCHSGGYFDTRDKIDSVLAKARGE